LPRRSHPPTLFPYTTLFRSEPLIHRKISNPEPPPARGSPSQYIPRRIDSRSVLRVALESAIRQRRPLAFLVDEAQHLAKISGGRDRKSTRLNSSHVSISYAV